MIIGQERPLVKHHYHPSIDGLSTWTLTVPIYDRLAYDIILSPYISDQPEAWKYINPITDLCLLDLRND